MRFCTVAKAKVSLCKCADSPEPSLLAQNGIQSPFVTKAQTRQSKSADSTKTSSFARINSIKQAFEPAREVLVQ